MKALVVSRLGLGERIIQKLRESGIKEFVDYYSKYDRYNSPDDIVKAVKETGCDSAVIIANFYTALALLANGIKTVYVIIPKLPAITEIVSAEVYEIRGNVNILSYKV